MWNPSKRKHTEEDTFKALQGYSFEDVHAAVMNAFKKQEYILNTELFIVVRAANVIPNIDLPWLTKRDQIIENLGWTHEQYVNEYHERRPK